MRATLKGIDRLPEGHPAKKQLLRAVRGNKYRAVRTEYKGRLYDSKAEARRAAELDVMKRSGLIHSWYPQPPFTLEGVKYRPDFLVFKEPGRCWAEDVKGPITGRFRAVKQLWKLHGPCELRLLFRKGEGWNVETIHPENP